MSLDLSVRLGELGRPYHLVVKGRWVRIFWLLLGLLLVGFGALSYQVFSAARIYPELLYQIRRTSSLNGKMVRLRDETSQLRAQSLDLDQLTRRLGGRFGVASVAATGAEQLLDGQKLMTLLFPDPSGSGNWSREAADLGEQTTWTRHDLTRIEGLAQAKIAQLERTPSILPARGQLSSGFGWRVHPILGEYKMHEGQDVTGPSGIPVTATAMGKVVTREYSSSFGNYVVLAHGGGIRTLYAHLSAFKCELGQSIRRGQVIGLLGTTGRSTGPHVHYEVHIGERPVDPESWILPTTLVP